MLKTSYLFYFIFYLFVYLLFVILIYYTAFVFFDFALGDFVGDAPFEYIGNALLRLSRAFIEQRRSNTLLHIRPFLQRYMLYLIMTIISQYFALLFLHCCCCCVVLCCVAFWLSELCSGVEDVV